MTEENTLPYYVDSLDNIPESLHAHYVEDEGSYRLNVANVVPKAKLDEFRENNRRLKAERDELNDRYSYVDLDEYKNLKERANTDSAKGTVHQDEVETLLQKRTTNMREEYEQELKKMQTEYDQAQKQLQTLLIDNAVSASANKLQVRQTALEDVMLRAKQTFRVEDGQVRAFDTDGNFIASKTGDGSMGIEEWMRKLSKNAPHLFEESVGASAPGAKKAVNPGNDLKNMTAAEKIAFGLKQNT